MTSSTFQGFGFEAVCFVGVFFVGGGGSFFVGFFWAVFVFGFVTGSAAFFPYLIYVHRAIS